MKKFQFLLLDAGPIIKLFELDIWDKFLHSCDVTISRTVIPEVKWASQELEDVCIDMAPYEEKGLIRIIDRDAAAVMSFYSTLNPLYKNLIDPDDGEVATMEFLLASSEKWFLCSADGPVFRLLGSLGRGEQGRSLEEMLKDIGLQPGICWDRITPRDEDWKYTKKFREKFTSAGQVDSIQGQGLV